MFGVATGTPSLEDLSARPQHQVQGKEAVFISQGGGTEDARFQGLLSMCTERFLASSWHVPDLSAHVMC